MKVIRALIADNHFFYHSQIAAFLTTAPEIDIVGQAHSGVEAVVQTVKYAPDVMLMDIDPSGFNGVETIQHLLQINPKMGILILTARLDDELMCRVMHAGARGYLLKGGGPEELLAAVRAVARGQAFFGATIASRLPAIFAAQPVMEPVCPGPDLLSALTAREQEIAGLIAQGFTNRQIAAQLFVSEKTVRNHISRLFPKLQVTNRCQAILIINGQ